MSEDLVHGVIVFLALASAMALGICAWFAYESYRRRREHRNKALGEAAGAIGKPAMGTERPIGRNDLTKRIIHLAVVESRKRELQPKKPLPKFMELGAHHWMERLPLAGLEGQVSTEGFCSARFFLSLASAMAMGVAGLGFSQELAYLFGAFGLYLGWRALPWAIEKRIQARVKELERHLSETLDVVALGLRSGLSFDRSLSLYTEYFPSLLSSSLSLAQQQWTHGLVCRDEALRNVAATYDSSVFNRVVENIIRSLRYGSSLAESLEASAMESRLNYRARRQEEVAKAPVKMMVPTGALILPAMLILVLGPVLLELIGGF